MPTNETHRRLSFPLLCAVLAIITVLFGVRATYSSGTYYALAFFQFALACLAAWKLGVWAILSESSKGRMLAVTGALLILPWILFSFLAGLSVPQVSTPSENQLRYTILLINTFSICSGLVVLRQVLSQAGEQFYSTLGFACLIIASPLYAIFSAISLVEFREIERSASALTGGGEVILDELSLVALFFGAALTYLATAAFAAALVKVKLLGPKSARVYVALSLCAALCVAVKIANVICSAHKGMWDFAPWFAMPGTVLSIPAMPWIMLVLIGVALVRRAGSSQA